MNHTLSSRIFSLIDYHISILSHNLWLTIKYPWLDGNVKFRSTWPNSPIWPELDSVLDLVLTFSSHYDDSALMPTFDPSDQLESFNHQGNEIKWLSTQVELLTHISIKKTHLNTKILIHLKLISKYLLKPSGI